MVYLSSFDYTILFLLSRKLKGQFGGIKNVRWTDDNMFQMIISFLRTSSVIISKIKY